MKIENSRELDEMQRKVSKNDSLKSIAENVGDEQSDETGGQIVHRLKQEIKELKVSIDIYQSDLHQQQHATEKMRKKQESDIENISR